MSQSSTVSLRNKLNFVPNRAETLKMTTTRRTHVVTLTAGSLDSVLKRVPMDVVSMMERIKSA